MMQEKKNGNTIAHVPFDLKDMNEAEMKGMFMSVSAKSLSTWLSYYEGKEQYEICKIIKEIRDYKNGFAGLEGENKDPSAAEETKNNE
jgi:hypothetical protein